MKNYVSNYLDHYSIVPSLHFSHQIVRRINRRNGRINHGHGETRGSHWTFGWISCIRLHGCIWTRASYTPRRSFFQTINTFSSQFFNVRNNNTGHIFQKN